MVLLLAGHLFNKVFKDKTGIIRALFDFFYPIGSYYETSESDFDPNVTWGGTWSLELAGQVHVSAGTGYTVAGALTNTSDGGSKDAIVPYHNHGHNITYTQNSSGTCSITSSGAHVHTLNLRNVGTTGTRATNNVTYGASGHDYQNSNPVVSSGSHTHTVPNHTHTGSISGGISYAGTDGNTANANMPPYIVVYRWHRTA